MAKRRGAARRVRTVLLGLFAGLVCVLVLIVGYVGWSALLRPRSDVGAGVPVTVEIAEGASTAAIADQLANAGVIANAGMFRLRARAASADGSLRPGTYELETGMSYAAAIAKLLEGPPVRHVTVTIPEGFVVEQIAARLEEQAGIPASETLELAEKGAAEFADEHPYLADAHDGSLEGYLFPKTYSVRIGSSAREVLEMMLDQFDTELAQVDLTSAAVADMSLNQVVVLASMIEREAQLDEERPLVSSVIHNRLERGMRLEIDATVEYVLPGNRFRLRYSDLRIDSPYNTYRYRGLPPGPIASPGLASLQAATKPAATGYLYYVLTGKDGSHTFATNRKDFLIAKERSKEVFGR